MSSPLLVLDSHYLCHRSFHTLDLSWDGRATGVIYGFLKSISLFKEEFRTDRIAFCFEGTSSHREKLYPEYKQKRKQERSPEEAKAYASLGVQISELRMRYLPQIGFQNIFCYAGFESDDSMAEIARSFPRDQEVILVTGDQDLFQCLRPNVIIYSPQRGKLITDRWFQNQFQIPPARWALVKAIGGCSTDNVKGVPGVGEITALKFAQGLLSPDSKAYRSILSPEGKAIVRRNKKLVQLPFEGCPVPLVVKDEVSKKGWKEVCETLGMRSLAGRAPIAVRAVV